MRFALAGLFVIGLVPWFVAWRAYRATSLSHALARLSYDPCGRGDEGSARLGETRSWRMHGGARGGAVGSQ